jgi:hypothetical protein
VRIYEYICFGRKLLATISQNRQVRGKCAAIDRPSASIAAGLRRVLMLARQPSASICRDLCWCWSCAAGGAAIYQTVRADATVKKRDTRPKRLVYKLLIKC